MKKMNIIYLMTALVLITVTSCQKEEIRTLKATFEQYESNDKAYIDNDYYACWEDNDEVAINGTSCSVTIALVTGNSHANNAEIAIPSTLSQQNLLAFYPADKISDMSATGGTVDFPHIQTYRENADGKQIIDNPMAAFCPSDGDELKFHNLGSLLKVTIPNNEDIKAIQVKGIDNQMLCGKAQLRFDNNGNPILGKPVDGANSVTLRFPEAVRANGKSFYIVLPPNTDFDTFTIAVLSNNGTAWATHAKTATMGRVIVRNHIAAISYDLSHHEDYDFVADWTIRYSATQQITTSSSTNWGTFGATAATYSFGGSKGLIVFNDIITSIGYNAFQNNNLLKSINIPVSVTTIGNNAFSECSNLTTVSIPNVTTIEEEAFAISTNLTSVSMSNVTTIEENAFEWCTKLTSVSLPSIITVGNGAFKGSALASVSLPIATTVGNNAFSECSDLTTVSLPNVTTIGVNVFYGTALFSVSLPNATTIGNDAFGRCLNLTTVSLPSATTIGSSVFEYCRNLTTVEMPEASALGNRIFFYCENLSDIYSRTAAPSIVGDYAFYNVPITATIHLPSSMEDNSSVNWSNWPGGIIYDYDD